MKTFSQVVLSRIVEFKFEPLKNVLLLVLVNQYYKVDAFDSFSVGSSVVDSGQRN